MLIFLLVAPEPLALGSGANTSWHQRLHLCTSSYGLSNFQFHPAPPAQTWGASDQHLFPHCQTALSFPTPAPLQTTFLPFFNFPTRPFDFPFPVVHPALAKCHPHPLSSITLPSQGDHACQKLPPARAALLPLLCKSCCLGWQKSLQVQSIFLITGTAANKPTPSQASTAAVGTAN